MTEVFTELFPEAFSWYNEHPELQMNPAETNGRLFYDCPWHLVGYVKGMFEVLNFEEMHAPSGQDVYTHAFKEKTAGHMQCLIISMSFAQLTITG